MRSYLGEDERIFVGSEAIAKKGILSLSYPMETGAITSKTCLIESCVCFLVSSITSFSFPLIKAW